MVTYDSKSMRRRVSALWVLVAVVLVGLGAVLGGGARPALATGCTFSLNPSGYSGTEGTDIPVAVTRSGGSCANTLRLTFSPGTATVGVNYNDPGAIDLPFTTTDTTRTFIPGLHTLDDLGTGNKTVTVALSFQTAANGDFLSNSPETVTIIDNDSTTFTFAQNYVVAENGGPLTVTVNRNGPTTTQETATVQTANGSALSGSDYTAVGPQVLTFGIGVSSRTFAVAILNDAIFESQESFSLQFVASSIGTTGGPATVTINDDDGSGSLQFSLGAYSFSEGVGTATLDVTRIGGGTGPVTVLCSTTDGSATSGVNGDYTAVSNQMLSWSTSDTGNKQCSISILEDPTIEGPETLTVTLSSPTGGAVLGTPAAVILTITDNDGTGLIAYQSATYTVAETGGSAVITLVRTGGTTGAVTADCITQAGGTATANVDYTAGSFTASFATGVSTATCSIPIIDDATVEGPETVALGLTIFTGGAGPGVQSTAVLTIADNETAGPSVTSISPSFGPTLGGTVVTISGANFTGATIVKFGTLPAAFIINDVNTITATAPTQAAGVYDISVTTPTGTSLNTLNDNYTYTDGPTVTLVDPNTGPGSGVPTTFVTITGTNFVVGGAGMTVKFGTTATTNFTVTATTTINVVAPSHAAGTVDVIVTTPGGSSPISAADQFTFTGSTSPVVSGVSPSSGPTGTVVTISGSGFSGVSCPGGITFGGVSAASDGSCIVNSDSTITAKVPANAPGGLIDVRVTGPGGQSVNSSADNFTNTSSQSTYTYTLNFRFTLIGWAGPDNTPVQAALQGTANAQVEAAASLNNIYSSVTAIWTYDTASQSYKGYFPGSENIPGANDFSVFRSGVGYFIAINVQTIQWTVTAR